MNRVVVIPDRADLPAKPDNSVNPTLIKPYHWTDKPALWERHEHAYKLVQSFSSVDQFYQLFDYLRHADKEFYCEYGGEILHQVLTGTHDKYPVSFDQRYFKLIQLFSNFNISCANDFHLKAATVFQLSSNSLVRYERIKSASKNATGILSTYKHREEYNSHLPILPMSGGWEVKQYTMQQKNAFIYATRKNAVVRGKIVLENSVERTISPLTTLGDCAVAESKWLSKPNSKKVDHIGFFALPNTRISKAPTGIAFNIDNNWWYLNASADIYHYFRVAGKTIFGQESRRMERAFVLPRTGNSNYYCSLLNRLPAIFAYDLLGLEIPIISTYQLSEIELYFANKIGIDTCRIECDAKSEIVIENAIVPILADLKILFARYCMTLPKTASQFGKRIYISRANASDRPMVNEKALEQLLLSCGFDVVAMEQYGLEEQMAIAGNAELIVAPHGAGLANMIFSKQGTSIYELVPEYYMQSSFRQLAIDCGHKYSMQLGKQVTTTEGEPLSWVVDLDKVKCMLDVVLNADKKNNHH